MALGTEVSKQIGPSKSIQARRKSCFAVVTALLGFSLEDENAASKANRKALAAFTEALGRSSVEHMLLVLDGVQNCSRVAVDRFKARLQSEPLRSHLAACNLTIDALDLECMLKPEVNLRGAPERPPKSLIEARLRCRDALLELFASPGIPDSKKYAALFESRTIRESGITPEAFRDACAGQGSFSLDTLQKFARCLHLQSPGIEEQIAREGLEARLKLGVFTETYAKGWEDENPGEPPEIRY